MTRRTAAVIGAVVAAAALGLATLAPALGATPALPIPSDPRDALLTPFTGKTATPKPYPAQSVPQHPYMAPNQNNNIHNDAYQTDTYNRPGPLGKNPTLTSTLFVAECGSVTFDKRGRIVTNCISPIGATLRVLDPTTLATVMSYQLPGTRGSLSLSDFSGGGYFYLDHADRVVTSTFSGHLLWVAVKESTLTVVRDVDLTGVTAGSGIQSALPDWAGRVWFVTVAGTIGYVTPGGTIRTTQLPAGETNANSFAIDESGGVFIVSTHALYRYDVKDGKPSVTWRAPYDRGSRIKPGQVSQGSGTTPTLIGKAGSPGGGWVAITDNADPKMQVVVFKRGKAGPGKSLCKQPVFAADKGSDENSLVSVPGGLIAENNYGYEGALQGLAVGRFPDTEPGLVRVDVDYLNGGCHIAWENTKVRIPTVVSKASLATGLLYTYTRPAATELPWSGLPLPDLLAPDSWFFTAMDLRNGKQVYSRFVGTGIGYNNNYAPVSIGPDGSAYVGTLGGLVRIADSP